MYLLPLCFLCLFKEKYVKFINFHSILLGKGGLGSTRFVAFETQAWHNECFFCANCKVSMVGKGFIQDGNDIVCPECARKKMIAEMEAENWFYKWMINQNILSVLKRVHRMLDCKIHICLLGIMRCENLLVLSCMQIF